MTAERQQLGFAFGLSAALNLLLLFGLAWAMAVTEGLTRSSRRSLAALSQAAPALPETVTLMLSPDIPEPADTPRRPFVNSPDDAPDQAPLDQSSAPFISSQNLRAASEGDASVDGLKNRITQEGIDKPFLDLRDSDFRDGTPEPAPPVADRPPESPPSPSVEPATQAALAAPAMAPPATETTPLETPPAEPYPSNFPPEPTTPRGDPLPVAPPEADAPPAFRDPAAPRLLPVPAANAPRPNPVRAAPPLTRIPDRVPEAAYAPGMKKTRSLGTISNKGRASLDAVATAEGRFGKAIRTEIEKAWRRRMLTLSGMANPGLVEVEFEVDPKGRISNVRLTNPGEANPVMQDCALSAVIDAKLPVPPAELFEDLRDNLTGGRMRCSFSFLIY